MQKPVRLEINTAGAWKVIGRFDTADEAHFDAILNAAAHLARRGGFSAVRHRWCEVLR